MLTKDEEAAILAGKHYEVEPEMRQIFRLKGPPEIESNPTEPIKLLEVNDLTVPCGIMPLYFGPIKELGIRHRTVIVEITSDEFQKIQSQELELPQRWKVGELIPRPSLAETQ